MDDFEMLREPLLTEDGFVNPACLKEIESVLKNIPKTHERLSGNPEWATPVLTHYRAITAGLAYCAVSQFIDDEDRSSPPAFPPGLEKVIGFLHACIRKDFDKHGFAMMSLCDVSRMLYSVLYDQNVTLFDAWNTKECLGDHWLSLDALIHNVCLNIRTDRREFDRFKKTEE